MTSKNGKISGTIRSGRLERLLDRHVGSSLLRLLGATRLRKNKPEFLNTFGFCVFGAIGDVIIVSAIIKDIKKNFPKARIVLIVSSSNNAVVSLIPDIDTHMMLPLRRPDQAIKRIREEKIDVLIDCNQWLRISSLYCALSGSYTIGFRTSGQFRHYAYDCVIDHLSTRHELENYRALLAPLGITGDSPPTVRVPEKAYQTTVALPTADAGEQLPEEFIVFHPWAGGRNAFLKEWPIESWVLLAQKLTNAGYKIIITGGSMDGANTERLIKAAEEVSVCCQKSGSIPLSRVAVLLERAKVVVAVNTGIMHLAAAVGAKVVALHGPTNPVRWGPISDKTVVLVSSGASSGYLNLGFEFSGHDDYSMPSISVDHVMGAIEKLLGNDFSVRVSTVTDGRRAGAERHPF